MSKFYSKNFNSLDELDAWLNGFYKVEKIVGYATTGTGDISYQQNNLDTVYVTVLATLDEPGN